MKNAFLKTSFVIKLARQLTILAVDSSVATFFPGWKAVVFDLAYHHHIMWYRINTYLGNIVLASYIPTGESSFRDETQPRYSLENKSINHNSS